MVARGRRDEIVDDGGACRDRYMVEKLPLRRVVLALVLGAVGCNRTDARCPEGMKPVAAKSIQGKTLLCRSEDGQKAQWLELHEPKNGARERRQICLFQGGRPDGPFQSFHPGGRRWVEGQYRNGLKEGHWNQWNLEGNRVADGDYREGVLVKGAPVGIVARCESVSL
jgi:hypothetical protein